MTKTTKVAAQTKYDAETHAAIRASNIAAARAKDSLSIGEWCLVNGFSRASWYNFAATGLAPRSFRVGKCVRISRQAAQDWLREREAAPAAATAGAP